MKKLNLLVMGLLLPMLAAAQTVKSPNGNVSVTFSLTEKGQPTYEMSYKGKTVCKPSHLGLELAKDKHASKGMEAGFLHTLRGVLILRQLQSEMRWLTYSLALIAHLVGRLTLFGQRECYRDVAIRRCHTLSQSKQRHEKC